MKFILFVSLLVTAVAHASGVSYEGQILKPDGSPLSGAGVQFRLQVRTPGTNNCLMYEELKTVDMTNSNGNFALTLNDGSGTRQDTSGYSVDKIFANQGSFTFNAANCAAGSTYTPNFGDGRSLVVLFKDASMANFEAIPAETINYVPFAIESKQIAGFGADSLLRVLQADGVTPAPGLSPLSNPQYTELMALVNGTSTRFAQLGGSPLPAMTTGQVLGWNGSTWISQPAAGGTVTSVTAGAGLTGGTITSSGSIGLSSTGVAAATYGDAGSGKIPVITVDATGRITTASSVSFAAPPSGTAAGDLTGSYPNPSVANVGGSTATAVHAAEMAVNNATPSSTISTLVKRDASGNFSANSAQFNGLTLNNAGSLLNISNAIGGSWNMVLPATAGTANQVLTTNGSGTLSWSNPSVATPILSSNGSATSPAYSFSNSTGTGLYYDGSSTLGLSFGGAPVAGFSPNGSTFNINASVAYAASGASGPVPTGAYPVFMANNGIGDGNHSLVRYQVRNTSSLTQNAFAGAVSVTGASNYTPAYVIGASTGPNAYTERLRIDSSGNVGIGTTAPAYKLDVAGQLNATAVSVNGVAIAAPTYSSGICTLPSTTYTVGTANYTCTGTPTIPAGAAVHCSPTSVSLSGVTWGTSSPAAGQVRLTIAGSSASTDWKCAWMY